MALIDKARVPGRLLRVHATTTSELICRTASTIACAADVGAGERHNAARLLAAGRNHGLARFEPDAAAVVANPERVGGEVAVRHILCEPSPKFVVGNGEHVG